MSDRNASEVVEPRQINKERECRAPTCMVKATWESSKERMPTHRGQSTQYDIIEQEAGNGVILEYRADWRDYRDNEGV